jgi:RNA polymerase-binding transcription factor DksA
MPDRRLTSAERSELRSRLAARASELRLEVHEGLHPAVMDEVALASVARDASELELIDRALARIELPEFGYCAECGTGIALARLFAEPYALRCTRCQDRFEAAKA